MVCLFAFVSLSCHIKLRSIGLILLVGDLGSDILISLSRRFESFRHYECCLNTKSWNLSYNFFRDISKTRQIIPIKKLRKLIFFKIWLCNIVICICTKIRKMLGAPFELQLWLTDRQKERLKDSRHTDRHSGFERRQNSLRLPRHPQLSILSSTLNKNEVGMSASEPDRGKATTVPVCIPEDKEDSYKEIHFVGRPNQ